MSVEFEDSVDNAELVVEVFVLLLIVPFVTSSTVAVATILVVGDGPDEVMGEGKKCGKVGSAGIIGLKLP